MSAERVGAMLRETMEPVPARLAATGAMVTAEQAGHYCVPVKLKRLYRERKLGSPFAKGDDDRYDVINVCTYVYRQPAFFTSNKGLVHFFVMWSVRLVVVVVVAVVSIVIVLMMGVGCIPCVFKKERVRGRPCPIKRAAEWNGKPAATSWFAWGGAPWHV